MNIKRILVLMLFGLGMLPGIMPDMQAQTFDNLWKQVEEVRKKSLPLSMVQLTDSIYRKAEAEKNFPQMLRAYTLRMKCKEALTPDSFYTGLHELEQWMETTEKPLERAILNSLIAGVYADYAWMNNWQLRERKEITGELPADDMREWTLNMFIEKVREHTRKSLQDSLLLLETSTEKYIPFVELGDDSKAYHHDLYHLLGRRAIQTLASVNYVDREINTSDDVCLIYENMVNTYWKRNKDAYVLVKLDYLNWKNDSEWHVYSNRTSNEESDLVPDPYVTGLNELIDKFKTREICAEIYLAKATYASDKNEFSDALKICEEALRLYPRYKRMDVLKSLKERILSPYLNVTVNQIVYPAEEEKFSVRHKNLDGFTLQFYQNKKLVSAQHYSLLRPSDHMEKDTVYTFKTPDCGKYLMRIVPDTRVGKEQDNELYVTRMKVLTCSLSEDKYEVVVLDSKTGHPVQGASVSLYIGGEKDIQKPITDSNGRVVLSWKDKYLFLTASKLQDTAMPKQSISKNYNYVGRETVENIKLLTDRTLYRPGQTVYVKGIAYIQEADTACVIPNEEYTLTLRDANNQEIGKKQVRTNKFGSFSSDFTLPATCLNGVFYLSTGVRLGYTTIHVEEYKRPTFDITFDKQEKTYQLEEKIQMTGKVQSYSGAPLQKRPLKYTVTCSSFNFWRFTDSTQISTGEVLTDDNGAFTIPVELKSGLVYFPNKSTYYRYTVEATATGVSGETQTSSYTIFAGIRSLLLQVNGLEGIVCKDDSVKVVFFAQNLDWQPVEVKGDYRLYLSDSSSLEEPKGVPVLSGTFLSNKAVSFDWRKLPSGSYVLFSSVKDNQGKEVTNKTTFELFSTSDVRPAIKHTHWYYASNTQFDASHPGVFYYGTSEKDTYVMMDMWNHGKIQERKILNLTDTIIRFEYPYKEEYGDGISFNICMVRDGEIYQERMELNKRLPDKNLVMKWDVFRDKLCPGQQEKWKLTILTPQGKPAEAEMLAMMYDASLDKIGNCKPTFGLCYNVWLFTPSWMSNHVSTNSFYYWWTRKYSSIPEWFYDKFLLSSANSVLEDEVGYRKSPKRKVTRSYSMPIIMEDCEVQQHDELPAGALAEERKPQDPSVSAVPPLDLRTNFAETAFFYPHLQTDQEGQISFSFTMPQSLTRWSFQGYSHTKGMLTGTLEGEVTTSKEFMLSSNLPRFVRTGDETSVSASIVNMTAHAQTGTVSLVLFDPFTDKVVHTRKQEFTVAAGKTIGVNFMFTATGEEGVLACRIIADSGTFSDGEQQLLPVLSNKETLVETVPMPVRGEGKHTFVLDKLFNNHHKQATNRRLTVEFTSNPVWYAVQALPSLSEPSDNCAISWASAYYANALASHILNSQPRIKAVFDAWKAQGGTKETFLSNLQKNQEVKNILLSESPWLLHAEAEEQQKAHIATLFDLNTIGNNNSTALSKLKELQNSDGSWSWCEGMDGSPFVTTYIAELNARLGLLTGQDLGEELTQMQKGALSYIFKQVLKEYEEIRKSGKSDIKSGKSNLKNERLSYETLHYLYLVCFYGKIPESHQSVYNYFLSKVPALLTGSSVEEKALSALILDKAGRKKEAAEFIASLKEHLTHTDEQGLSFAFNEHPYSIFELQVPAHVAAMEAFESVSHDLQTVEEMKFWLLKQKQTQLWNTPVSTSNAVYALLLSGSKLLDTQNNVRISIGNKVMETAGNKVMETADNEEMETVSSTAATVPGLGYMKQTFTQKEVVNARKITVENRSPGIAWGAVYAQYQSPVSAVTQQGGSLNVKKQLYVERTLPNKVELQPVTDKTMLTIGDKVVSRIVITLDRPMDFIQLKDQRGACFEPIGSISGYQRSNGFGYYTEIKDASTNFFFDSLGKGVYVLEYSYRVGRSGTYEAGLATIQCAYAPEFASHSASQKVKVSPQISQINTD